MTRKVSGLITSLTLWDVVAMNIVAVTGLRWISRSARLGAPSVTLWIRLPRLLRSARRGARGALEQASRAGRHLRLGAARLRAVSRLRLRLVHVGQQPFYFPALLLFAGANMLVPLGADGAAIADSLWYSVTFVLGFLWLTTFLNVLGFSAGK